VGHHARPRKGLAWFLRGADRRIAKTMTKGVRNEDFNIFEWSTFFYIFYISELAK